MVRPVKQLDIVAIVPARRGSKRLPRKNTLPLAGKPLIQWTLDAVKASATADLIVVTSDDEEVLNIAASNGVMTILRPDYLASDAAATVDVVLHVLDTLKAKNLSAKRVMLLQPTSPLRRAEHIRAAIKRMDEVGASSIISVCEMEHSPLWSNTLPDDGRMDDFIEPDLKGKRSQDFSVYYRLNGAIYIVDTSEFLVKKDFFLDNCYSFCMPKDASVDIDSEYDLLIADAFLRSRK